MSEITTTNYVESQKNALAQLIDSAFGKALASVIMAEFPIASIIAIFMGRKATSLIAEADKLAAQTGLKASGKRIAAKIMSIVGFIAGIVNSVMYIFLGIYLIFYFILIFAMAFGG